MGASTKALVLTSYTYGGHSVFRYGGKSYVVNSRHLTKKAAENSPAYRDSFYLGKTTSIIRKYGRYYLVLQRRQGIDDKLKGRL